MKTKPYLLAAAVAVTTDAAAYIQLPKDGFLVAIRMTGNLEAPGTAIGIWQVSFNTSMANTNDYQGIVMNVNFHRTQVTAVGIVPDDWNQGQSGIAIPVRAGDRLYLHYAGSAVNTTCQVHLYIDEK